VTDRPASAAGFAPGFAPEFASVAERYFAALAAADRRAAVRIARELVDGGAPVGRVLTGLVSPAQIEVGRRWAANEWNVAQEHAATSISEEVVAAIAGDQDVEAHRGIAVVTCVEGEWHALPARLLAETLRSAGWDVRYLGASLPAAHLTQFIHDVGPDVVALSCSLSTSLPRARAMIEAARGGGVPVIAGGRGFGTDGRLAALLGANGWAASAPAAADMLAAPDWPRFTDRAPELRLVDDASSRLWDEIDPLTDAVEDELLRRFPAMAEYDEPARARTREDVHHILDFLAAALYVDDVDLFGEFVGWLDALLEARHVPATALTAGLDAVAAVLPPLPRASEFVTEAAARRRSTAAPATC
jgi:methanogenic corrinoid protein MtbC1